MPTTNAQQFEADLKAAKNGDTVTLKGNITKNIVINKLVNLDLNGKKITGNVTINTPAKGTINLKNGSIDGNLTVEAPQATVNNELTVTGDININNVAFGTWNEKANGNKLVVNDPDGIKLTVAPGKTVATITVAPEAVGEVAITNNGTIEKVDAQASVELVNNGSVEEVAGNSEVKLTGTGTVDKVTNEKPVVNESNQDAFLTKSGDLTLNQDRYETSFKWGSNNGIGSGEKSAHTSPGGYNYFGNGAYLDITVKKEGESSNAKFDDVLSQLTLQTNGGAIDDISGGAKADGRQPADWGKSTANQSFATKLKESGSNAVFYGVRQNNTNGIATVGFNAGEKRDINLTFSPKDGLAEGTYTITIQPKQQVSETAGKNIGDAITYTFVVKSNDATLSLTANTTPVDEDGDGGFPISIEEGNVLSVDGREMLYSIKSVFQVSEGASYKVVDQNGQEVTNEFHMVDTNWKVIVTAADNKTTKEYSIVFNNMAE